MDYLATFPNTQSVLQAEQILIRRKVPFETVPKVLINKERCGLAILFSAEYLASVQRALGEADLRHETTPINENNSTLKEFSHKTLEKIK